MRGDPTVVITCDRCEAEYEARLTALARNSFDERDVDDQLERDGWTKEGDKDFCSDCSSEDEE